MTGDLDSNITPELRFLAACSYRPSTAGGLRNQRDQLAASLRDCNDPGRLWSGIQRHKIIAMAERVLHDHGLGPCLGPYQADLATQARAHRRHAMRLTRASAAATELLSSSHIQHRFLKGPCLSQKLYGDASLRQSKDLDLFVSQADLAPALDLLIRNGWELRDGAMWQTGGLYRRLVELRFRHFQLLHAATRTELELHWRIESEDVPKLEEQWSSLWGPSLLAEVSLGEFLHLCLHGAVHGWAVLKWLGDLAAITDRDPHIWQASEAAAATLRLQPALLQARILLRRLYYGGEPPERGYKLTSQVTRQVRFALESMEGDWPARERTLHRWWRDRRYSAPFIRRASALDRWRRDAILAIFYDAPWLRRHPAFLAGMPLARATDLFRRYCLPALTGA